MRAERDFIEDQMKTIHGQSEQPEYLGALIEGERRLVLVPVDPQEPWAAFRKMRSWMRQSQAHASVDLFSAPKPLEAEAKVIPLRRRAAR